MKDDYFIKRSTVLEWILVLIFHFLFFVPFWLILYYFWISIYLLYFVPFTIPFIIIDLLYLRDLKVYFSFKMLQKYLLNKSTLIHFLELYKTQVKMILDLELPKPVNIDELGNVLNTINFVMKNFFTPMLSFKKVWAVFWWTRYKILHQFVTNEVYWLIEYINELDWLLKIWISDHKKKLHSEEIKLKESNNHELELASKRISTIISSLEKIQIKL